METIKNAVQAVVDASSKQLAKTPGQKALESISDKIAVLLATLEVEAPTGLTLGGTLAYLQEVQAERQAMRGIRVSQKIAPDKARAQWQARLATARVECAAPMSEHLVLARAQDKRQAALAYVRAEREAAQAESLPALVAQASESTAPSA